jgi:hypothetical protein
MASCHHYRQSTGPSGLPHHEARSAIGAAARGAGRGGERGPSLGRRDGESQARAKESGGVTSLAEYSTGFGHLMPTFSRRPTLSSLSRFCARRATRFPRPPSSLFHLSGRRTRCVTRASFPSQDEVIYSSSPEKMLDLLAAVAQPGSLVSVGYVRVTEFRGSMENWDLYAPDAKTRDNPYVSPLRGGRRQPRPRRVSLQRGVSSAAGARL